VVNFFKLKYYARAWKLGKLEKLSSDKHLNAAKPSLKTLIQSTGYHLCDKAVLELEKLTF